MRCKHCKKEVDAGQAACPHCGRAVDDGSGVFHTSSVLISAGASRLVYRSVSEVPPALRGTLIKSTSGTNSATILIADRRGRREIAKAMRNLSGTGQKRLLRSLLGREETPERPRRLYRRRSLLLAVLLALIAIALVALVFVR